MGKMGNGDLVSTSPLKENAEIRGVVLVLWATNTLSSTLLGFYCFQSQKRKEVMITMDKAILKIKIKKKKKWGSLSCSLSFFPLFFLRDVTSSPFKSTLKSSQHSLLQQNNISCWRHETSLKKGRKRGKEKEKRKKTPEKKKKEKKKKKKKG
eukprot:TRINITY_DN633_c1_g1_i2.p1 TRINITY_DN633_c1_g1~~TRINITY_DN633_c1_g1_i2.p1  ORF type:complete len:152 (-),score=15.83 TRINITY_DN633_c1_g1_i2:3-458(-)